MPASDDLGSGIALDEELDLVIDETGDVGYSTGVSELEKDLAFRMIQSLDSARGLRNRPAYMKDIELFASRVALADDRIDTVYNVDARPIDTDDIEIVMSLGVGDEDIEAIVQL